MTPRIPPDVERLMWLVSESNDPQALQDFEERFPQFTAELGRRRRMVSDLKGAKTVAAPTQNHIPTFTPRQVESNGISRSVWVVGSLAAAALAFASYSIGVWVTKDPPKLPPIESVQTTPVAVPNTNVYTPPIEPKSEPVPTQPKAPDPINAVPEANREPLRTLKLSNTSLAAALKMIGEMAGYRVEIAPGFKDQQVSIDYTDSTTSNMVKHLGMRYGFTAFDQGDGTVIIVPAVDSQGPAGDPVPPDPRIGGE